MERLIILAMLLVCFPAKSEETTGVIDSTPNKAVCFEKTLSDNGRFAIGWTLRPKGKKPKPVDWSLYDPKDPAKLFDAYDWDPHSNESPYEIVDGVIDLKQKRIVELPAENPYWPMKERGRFAVIWNKPFNGWQYGLVQNDFSYFTANLWLIAISGNSIQVIDLTSLLKNTGERYLFEKKLYPYGTYGTSFPIAKSPTSPGVTFGLNEAEIPFLMDIRTSVDDTAQVKGTISIHLADWIIFKSTCSTKVDNPMKDVAQLAQAESTRKEIYLRLLKKLSPKQQVLLREFQRRFELWGRPAIAAQAAEQADIYKARLARDQSLLATTRKMTEELKEDLKLPAKSIHLPEE